MSDLPNVKVSESKTAFSNTGIDFCGPFFVKEKKFRNRGRGLRFMYVYLSVWL